MIGKPYIDWRPTESAYTARARPLPCQWVLQCRGAFGTVSASSLTQLRSKVPGSKPGSKQPEISSMQLGGIAWHALHRSADGQRDGTEAQKRSKEFLWREWQRSQSLARRKILRGSKAFRQSLMETRTVSASRGSQLSCLEFNTPRWCMSGWLQSGPKCNSTRHVLQWNKGSRHEISL